MIRYTILSSIFAALFLAIPSILKSQCTADFDTTISGLTVTFTNQATGSYNYIEYDYGDGDWDAYINSPVHTYDDPGIYVACQFILDTNTFNCFDEYCDTLYLGGATCMAEFYPELNGLDLELYTEAIGVYDSIWYDFGDGNGSNDTAATHSYSSTGYYDVCLYLYSNGSLCDSTCYEIYADDTPCEADFSYSDDDLDVDFTDESTGNYNAIYWDFGDGFGFSEEFDPSYTYFTGGTYEVCVYIYDSLNFSCEDEYCEFITVEDGGGGGGGCDADFSYEDDQLEFTFTNESTGGIINTWDFGDGSGISFDENPVHTYATPGTYEVCVTVVNPFPFCTDTYCEFVEAKEYNCEPTFTYSFNASNAYTFTNTTTVGNVTSVLWDFGDGNTSTFAQPTYTYNAPGTYTVCLTTFDEGSECGETCQDLAVYPLGTKQPLRSEDVKLIPNPNNGDFSIILPSGLRNNEVSIQVMDLSGRLVHSQNVLSAKAKMDMNLDLSSGTYILLLGASNEEQVALRMVIQ